MFCKVFPAMNTLSACLSFPPAFGSHYILPCQSPVFCSSFSVCLVISLSVSLPLPSLPICARSLWNFLCLVSTFLFLFAFVSFLACLFCLPIPLYCLICLPSLSPSLSPVCMYHNTHMQAVTAPCPHPQPWGDRLNCSGCVSSAAGGGKEGCLSCSPEVRKWKPSCAFIPYSSEGTSGSS